MTRILFDVLERPFKQINEIFGGQFRHRITCHECGQSRDQFEPFLSLAINLPASSPGEPPLDLSMEETLNLFLGKREVFENVHYLLVFYFN